MNQTRHLTARELVAIKVFLEQVQQHFPHLLCQAILFGSKARGDSHAYSDIDVLLIVEEESWPLRQEISTLAAQTSLAHDVLIEPRVIGQARWDKMRRHHFVLYENVQAEGVGLLPAESA